MASTYCAKSEIIAHRLFIRSGSHSTRLDSVNGQSRVRTLVQAFRPRSNLLTYCPQHIVNAANKYIAKPPHYLVVSKEDAAKCRKRKGQSTRMTAAYVAEISARQLDHFSATFSRPQLQIPRSSGSPNSGREFGAASMNLLGLCNDLARCVENDPSVFQSGCDTHQRRLKSGWSVIRPAEANQNALLTRPIL